MVNVIVNYKKNGEQLTHPAEVESMDEEFHEAIFTGFAKELGIEVQEIDGILILGETDEAGDQVESEPVAPEELDF